MKISEDLGQVPILTDCVKLNLIQLEVVTMTENENLENALKKLGIVGEKFSKMFNEQLASINRIHQKIKNSESFKNKEKYKKRVANRERLYQKRMAKYGRF